MKICTRVSLKSVLARLNTYLTLVILFMASFYNSNGNMIDEFKIVVYILPWSVFSSLQSTVWILP